MSEVRCALCPFMAENLAILEGHINADHLDYFPYGCAYCGHWMTTEEIAHQHVEMKKHLPIKIKENLDWSKEQRLKKLLETSRNGNFSREENISKSTNEGNSESIASSLPTSSNAQQSDDGDNSSVSSSVIFEFEEHPEIVANERSGKEDNRDSNEKCTRREHQDEYQNKIEDTNCSAIDERTYEESPTLNPPISLQCCDANSNQRSTTRNALLSDFLGDDSIGYQSTSAKKPNKHLRCLICQVDVVYSLVANHIYSIHIADKHAVKCAYCNFGTFYAKSDALRHVRAIHPHLPTRVIDRRKSHLRVAYNSWRSICFPNIGRNRRPIGIKAPVWLSNNGASVRSRQPETERSLLNSQVIQSSKEDQVKCVRCQKKFDKNKISSHLRDEHFADLKKFTCVGCSKSFNNLIDIQTHCQEQHKPATEYESNIETTEQFDLLLQQCLNDTSSTMNDVKSDLSTILLRK